MSDEPVQLSAEEERAVLEADQRYLDKEAPLDELESDLLLVVLGDGSRRRLSHFAMTIIDAASYVGRTGSLEEARIACSQLIQTTKQLRAYLVTLSEK